MAVERGEPVRISRNDLERVKQDFSRQRKKMDGPLPEIPLLSTPDHILESRGDCAITFIEEGLLPLVRDKIHPETQDALQLAEDFMDQFRRDHPNDFDLKDPLDLIAITDAQLLPLSIIYIVKGRRSIEDQKLANLIGQASELLGEVMEEAFPDDDTDEEDD